MNPEPITALTAVSGVVADVWGYFADCVTTANTNLVMWVPVAFGIAGATVGLLRRATRVGGRRR